MLFPCMDGLPFAYVFAHSSVCVGLGLLPSFDSCENAVQNLVVKILDRAFSLVSFVVAALRIESKVLCIPGKCFTVEPRP